MARRETTEEERTPAVKGELPVSAEVMRIQADKALAVLEDPFQSVAAFQHWWRVAELFASSDFVPDAFKGKAQNCLIAMNLAHRMGEDPLRVMQGLYVVGGRPAWMTEFAIARTNRLRVFKGRIRWKTEPLTPPTLKATNAKGSWDMPNLRVTAMAIDHDGELLEKSVDTQLAIAEEWTKNAKYRTMPENMLEWRAASWLIRKYAPEVLQGIPTREEAEQLPPPAKADQGAVVALGKLDAFAAKHQPPVEEAEVIPDRNRSPRLTPPQVERVRAAAEAAGVPIAAIEEAWGQSLAELTVHDEKNAETEVLAWIHNYGREE